MNHRVYLLTPMDCATLINAKSTISHCLASLITRQRTSVDSKLLHRPRNVGYYHIIYLNDNAQTPHGRFVVDILYNQTSPFNSAHMTFYSTLIEIIRLSCTVSSYSAFFVDSGQINPPHLHLSPHRGWSRSNFTINFGVKVPGLCLGRFATIGMFYFTHHRIDVP